MAILPIIKVPNPLLTTKAQEVEKIDKKILNLIADMKDTLKAQRDPEGVGIAAPQVGRSLKLFVISQKSELKTFINPEITWRSKETYSKVQEKKKHFMEGCLSIPKIYGPVERANAIKVKYLSESGKEFKEKYEGIPAVYIQHEYDHIKGVLFTSRVIEQGGKMYELEGKKWKELDV